MHLYLYKVMEEGQAQPHIKRQEPRHEHPKPNQERLGQREERLGQRKERLAQGGERLKGERLEGRGEHLGPITRSMTKLRMGDLGQAMDGRESNLYMLHEGPLRIA